MSFGTQKHRRRGRRALLVLGAAAAVGALSATSAAANTVSLTLVNQTGQGQPLNSFAQYVGVGFYSHPTQTVTIPDGGQGSALAYIDTGLNIDSQQVWLYRYGNTGPYLVIETDGDTLQCGWTDANAGWDGETINNWLPQSGCELEYQSGGGPNPDITGTVYIGAPTISAPAPSCTADDTWSTSSDTGVAVTINNGSGQTLNLVNAQLQPSNTNNIPNFVQGASRRAIAASIRQAHVARRRLSPRALPRQTEFGSIMDDSWQYPPDQQISPAQQYSTYCAYDASTDIGGSNLGTEIEALYEVGDSGQYLVFLVTDPVFGSNATIWNIVDVNGNPITGSARQYSASASIQGTGYWHATASIHIWAGSS
jgi:hypothetical protein